MKTAEQLKKITGKNFEKGIGRGELSSSGTVYFMQGNHHFFHGKVVFSKNKDCSRAWAEFQRKYAAVHARESEVHKELGERSGQRFYRTTYGKRNEVVWESNGAMFGLVRNTDANGNPCQERMWMTFDEIIDVSGKNVESVIDKFRNELLIWQTRLKAIKDV